MVITVRAICGWKSRSILEGPTRLQPAKQRLITDSITSNTGISNIGTTNTVLLNNGTNGIKSSGALTFSGGGSGSWSRKTGMIAVGGGMPK